jgi:hypothetical protein
MLVNRFATEETAQQLIGADGMSLRDYFAGMALQGMIAGGNSNAVRLLQSKFETYGEAAYSAADEMLTARERKEDA